MKIEQDGVIDTGRKEITESGTINGFKKYAGHECMVLVFEKKLYKPMPKDMKHSIAKAIEKSWKNPGVKVVDIEDCPYGGTDSGVPGTIFHLSDGESVWIASEIEPGCIDVKKQEVHYCVDCPWGFVEGSNGCQDSCKKGHRKMMR